MASLLRRFAPLIVGFVIKKIMNKRGGGTGQAGGYQQPGRRR
ncbi:hypothetical protein [Frigoribacterium sp. PhB24]|nr:hypothetical protein [Frigoribacterium sp. PhB24]ROS51246.1 hypothetical protein EDF50_1552 [Frigoribacterium sp. PhB24]